MNRRIKTFYQMENVKKEDPPFIFTVGGVKPRKGADVTIQALALLKNEFPKNLFYKGFLNLTKRNWQKMSKNLGNFLTPKFKGRIPNQHRYIVMFFGWISLSEE